MQVRFVSRLLLWLLAAACTGMSACKKAYVCPAYQSAFVLDMPAYKVSHALDSMSLSADTSLDVDVIAVLAERIRKEDVSDLAYDADSVPQFPSSPVVKTQVLLIRRSTRKSKEKMLATVPMVTVFPESPKDSTQAGEEGLDGQNLAPEGTKPESEEGLEAPNEEKTDEQPADAPEEGLEPEQKPEESDDDLAPVDKPAEPEPETKDEPPPADAPTEGEEKPADPQR